jgi:hypothetical protein
MGPPNRQEAMMRNEEAGLVDVFEMLVERLSRLEAMVEVSNAQVNAQAAFERLPTVCKKWVCFFRDLGWWCEVAGDAIPVLPGAVEPSDRDHLKGGGQLREVQLLRKRQEHGPSYRARLWVANPVDGQRILVYVLQGDGRSEDGKKWELRRAAETLRASLGETVFMVVGPEPCWDGQGYSGEDEVHHEGHCVIGVVHVAWDAWLARRSPRPRTAEEGYEPSKEERVWCLAPVQVVHDDDWRTAHGGTSWVMQWRLFDWCWACSTSGDYKPPGYYARAADHWQYELFKKWHPRSDLEYKDID